MTHRFIRKGLIGLAAGAASLGLLAAPVSASESSIAEVASGNADFATLVAAVTAADLAGTLADCSAGPFTVFAPTNEAFAAALAALGISAEALLADTATLTSVLTYHVVPGKVMAADVVGLSSATTLQGSDISIAVVDGAVKLNGTTTVTATDANGDPVRVEGEVILRRVNDVPGASEEQLRWLIRSADLERVAG